MPPFAMSHYIRDFDAIVTTRRPSRSLEQDDGLGKTFLQALKIAVLSQGKKRMDMRALGRGMSRRRRTQRRGRTQRRRSPACA